MFLLRMGICVMGDKVESDENFSYYVFLFFQWKQKHLVYFVKSKILEKQDLTLPNVKSIHWTD